ncbi:hypothetical protein PHLGIDRAFT_366080 [Phlebiopsis gigantea 11061_1 CR5-6]|uniref:Uncharacterized protein n=1 Tax=Phlebiopsis gigantea (strain 11061_1 CR5-6) TaxID=745531 RepID=A0A0C3PP60_PHLG1|nr:hypothetical protein PHLGIDRAFT_366080 [Phlebiopsis gigantea 11061_1 CR5-6]
MRARNPRVLRDVTPRNTPQSKRISSRATTKLKAQAIGSATRLPALNLKGVEDKGKEVPKVPVPSARESPSALPVATSHALSGSTPLVSRTRVVHSSRKTSGPLRTDPISPLPPSSPPSMSSFDDDAENRPPLQPERSDDAPEVQSEGGEIDAPEPEPVAKKVRTSSDDPFGFDALERRLKIQRELRRRAMGPPAPLSIPKGKGIAYRRVPFGEIHVEPVASTSGVRASTPYHPSDDLEDMYLDVSHVQPQEDRSESVRPADAREDELALPAAREPTTSDEEDDPTRTPHPQHVANIIPLKSPFSSRDGTPCDRSLPDSPLSSPSPVKPLTVSRPLPVLHSSTAKKEKGKVVIGKDFPSSTPIPTPLPAMKRAKVTSSSPTRIHPIIPKRVAEAREETAENPIVTARNLEKLLPKRPAKRATKLSPAVAGSSSPIKGPGRPRRQVPVERETGSGGESSEDEHHLPSPSSPLARGKRRAPVLRQFPVKRMKVEVIITKRPPRPSGRAKPSSSRAKPARKPKSKGKGKAGPGTQKVGDEDSVRSFSPMV